MTDLPSRFTPRLPQDTSREPIPPDLGTTTTTRPRFRPGDSPDNVPSTTTTTTVPRATTPPREPVPTSPPTTSPMLDMPEPTLEDARRQGEAFANEMRNQGMTLEEYANDPRYQYTMPPLGLRGMAAPITRREQTGNIVTERQEYALSPEQSRNRALERFNLEAEQIIASVSRPFAFGGEQLGATMRAARARGAFIDVDAGDKYTTAVDVFDYLNAMTTNELNFFKYQLLAVGLLKPNQLGEEGVKDINDDVWRAALTLGERANENGIKYAQFAQFAVDNSLKFQIPKTEGPRVPPVRLSSPDDLRFTANQVALRRLGREFTQPEQEAFITSFNQVERDFHSQYYRNAAEVVQPPSPQTAAESRIQSEFMNEAEMYSMGNVLDSFRSIMAGQL
jgi:hypothetical protein